MNSNQAGPLTVFLCGDVMTGRGIDQVLPYPGLPTLYESYVKDARDYVKLAERVNGPITRPVSFKYIWGDALAELNQSGVDVRIINLETSITRSDDYWPGKSVHYRMHPQNVGCLTAAGIDACSLANNHVLDWGYAGLTETLQNIGSGGRGTRRGRAKCSGSRGSSRSECTGQRPGAPLFLRIDYQRHSIRMGRGPGSAGGESSWGPLGSHGPGDGREDEAISKAGRRDDRLDSLGRQLGL